jgi:hypothetical protein
MCQKSPKWMLSLCFKARHPFSIMKKHHPHCFRCKGGENDAAAISKVHYFDHPKQKRRGDKQTKKNKLTGMQNLKIQKIQKFNLNAHTHIIN